MTTMDAARVRQTALEIAESILLEAAGSGDVCPAEGCLTPAEEDAVRVELRVIAEGVASRLNSLLPQPVQPVWSPVYPDYAGEEFL